VHEADGEALALAVAENVIRADLNPVEEARVYRRLLDEHTDAATVARLVGESVRLVAERLDLPRLTEDAQALVAARHVPLPADPGRPDRRRRAAAC
jgi:ParB family chromosome partitioning protein